MPGFVMHLSEAKMVMERWKKRLDLNSVDLNEWERKFLYGALLPDSNQFPGGKDGKAVSHFWYYSRATHVFMVPDLKAFQDKYKDKLSDPVHHPVLAGYMAHLHLDMCYFRDFMPSVVILEDENGNHTNIRQDIRSVYIRKNGKRIPRDLLFTDAYLYGDYLRLNTILIELYKVDVLPYDPQILLDEPIPEVEIGNMESLLTEMKKYLRQSKPDTPNLQIFPEGVVVPFLQACADQYFDYYKS